MIPAKQQEYEVESTLRGDDVAMSIDENSLVNLMQLLTDLYSDPEMAVMREYSTNALDANIAAGNTDPIQVTLPSSLAPFLTIHDDGIGLDADDIRNIYSKYGLSTKTDTNEQTGVLGVGCKSALTYTRQFTLVGRKNGIKTSVSVSRDEEGLGHMTIVDRSETDEPNGVDVIVPAELENTFAEKAAKLFRFWPAGTVLVNGEEPERLTGLQITEDMLLSKLPEDRYGSRQAPQVYLVMGGVPYPVDRYQSFKSGAMNGEREFSCGLEYGYMLTVRVPMGSVHFPGSREQLTYSKHTQKTLGLIQDTFAINFPKAVSREINSAHNGAEALKRALTWADAISRFKIDELTYKGHRLPEEIKSLSPNGFIVSKGQPEHQRFSDKAYRVGKHSTEGGIHVKTLPSTIWVHNFRRSFTPACKKKLWKYCDDHNIEYPKYFVMTPSKLLVRWIAPEQWLDWTPIEAIKLPRAVHNGGGSSYIGERKYAAYVYDVQNTDSRYPHISHAISLSADEIDDLGYTIYYANTTNGYNPPTLAHNLSRWDDEFVFVGLSQNRIEKFLRHFPEAIEYNSVVPQFAEAFVNSLSVYERIALGLNGNTYLLAKLPVRALRDPELRRAVYALRQNNGKLDTLRKNLHLFDHHVSIDSVENPLERYPLVRYTRYAHHHDDIKHIVIYLNAAYKAERKKEGNRV